MTKPASVYTREKPASGRTGGFFIEFLALVAAVWIMVWYLYKETEEFKRDDEKRENQRRKTVVQFLPE
jgi:hypothetical protein